MLFNQHLSTGTLMADGSPVDAGSDEVPAFLLERCRTGDRRALRELIERYQDAVFALCTALAGQDAEDLAQETFLRVVKAIATFEPNGPATLRSWILIIARRLCYNRARRHGPGREVPASDEVVTVPSEHSPFVDVLTRQRRQRVLNALAALPDEHRTVLALREWVGLSYAEIARIEGVEVGTVRSRISRAKARLREVLA